MMYNNETDPIFETLCFLVFRIANDGQSPPKHVMYLELCLLTNDKHCIDYVMI
jgi:hypothetical protein